MQRGQKVAVVGESGSGKSTVMASWMKNTSFNSPQMVAKSKGNGTGKTAVVIGPDLNGTHIFGEGIKEMQMFYGNCVEIFVNNSGLMFGLVIL